MSSAQRRTTAIVAAVLSLALLGISPCSSDYEASHMTHEYFLVP